MKITISGSLGNIGKPLTQKLVAAGHSVQVISSSEARRGDIEALGAEAVIGSVADADFLANAFEGTGAVFAMTPPNLGGSDVVANTIAAGDAFADAFVKAGVKRVVMLSSIGGDLADGNGPIKGIHHIEQRYNALDGVAVTFLRAGYFFTNFYNDIPVIKGMGVMGANYPSDIRIPLVHPADIASAAAEELQREATGKDIRYIVGDLRKPAELAQVLGTAIGKPELPWLEFTDEQSLNGMIQAGVPEEIAALYTEMGVGLRNGRIAADFLERGAPLDGQIKLETFAKEFAVVFS